MINTDNKNRRGYGIIILMLIICVLGFGIVYYLHSTVTYQSDDFYYSTFWDGGLKNFIKMSIDHYKTFNGRVFVHFIAQTVLAFDLHVYAVLNTLMLIFLALVGYRCCRDGQRARAVEYVSCAAAFSMMLLLVGRDIWNEGLLWISGSYNYMLPTFMFLIALVLQKRFLITERNGFCFTAIYVIIQFLSGATTEQSGIMTICGSVIYLIYMLTRHKCRVTRIFTAPVLNIVGLITIFLSPATRDRAEGVGISVSTIIKNYSGLSKLYSSYNGALVVLVVFCVLSAALYNITGKKSRLPLLGLPAAVLVAVLGALGAYELSFAVFTVYALFVAIACIVKYCRPAMGVILLSGLASAYVMLTTSVLEPRVALPLTLLFCAVGAYICSEIILEFLGNRRGEYVLCTVLIVCFCICVAVVFPIIKGYTENYKVTKQNYQEIRNAKSTGELYYLMDYNNDYCHMTMYFDGYFYGKFKDCFGLNDCRIYLVSEKMKPVYANGERLTSPAYVSDGNTYFSARDIIEALGGNVTWSKGKSVFSLDGTVMYYDGTYVTAERDSGTVTINVSAKQPYGYYTKCFTADVYEKIFGIEIVEDSDCFTAIK